LKGLTVEEIFDELNPLYWFDKPLLYTIHAENRALERKVPVVDYFPVNCKIRTSPEYGYEVVFKLNSSKYTFIVSGTGTVITLYNYNYNYYKSKKELIAKEISKIKEINAKKYPQMEFYAGIDDYADNEENYCYM
jgi:hypothetical protein